MHEIHLVTTSNITKSLFFRYMGFDADPSWAEICNFIQFLNSQLCDCEQSPYCLDPGFIDAGFKEFVIKFAILMAKVNNHDYNNYTGTKRILMLALWCHHSVLMADFLMPETQ